MIDRIRRKAVVPVLALIATAGAHGSTLSAVVGFGTDGTGFSNGGIWTSSSMCCAGTWLTQGTLGAPFITGTAQYVSNLNFSLTPGTVNLFMFMEGAFTVSTGGVNLFFNGNTTTPGISVFAPSTSSTASVPSFFAGSSQCTVGGTPVNPAVCVPGSGKLTYDDGINTIVLSAFQWDNPVANGLDRVQGAAAIPGGGNDNIAQLTLTITADQFAVPEPLSVLLMGMGLAGIACTTRLHKRTSGHRLS